MNLSLIEPYCSTTSMKRVSTQEEGQIFNHLCLIHNLNTYNVRSDMRFGINSEEETLVEVAGKRGIHIAFSST